MKEVAKILDPEGELLNILNDRSALEWRRYRQRYPNTWAGEKFERTNHSEFPPFVAFRFEREDQDLIISLKNAISSYNGSLLWLLESRARLAFSNVNWIIFPAHVSDVESKANLLDMSSEDYIARYEPEFGSAAFDDLLSLTKHIRRVL